MVPRTHFEGSELTQFNLVMRLCKVKRSAIPFTTILRLLAAPAVFENLWAIFQTDGTVTRILIWPQ